MSLLNVSVKMNAFIKVFPNFVVSRLAELARLMDRNRSKFYTGAWGHSRPFGPFIFILFVIISRLPRSQKPAPKGSSGHHCFLSSVFLSYNPLLGPLTFQSLWLYANFSQTKRSTLFLFVRVVCARAYAADGSTRDKKAQIKLKKRRTDGVQPSSPLQASVA